LLRSVVMCSCGVPSQVLHVYHLEIDVEIFAISDKEHEPEIPRSSLSQVIAAQKVRRYLVDLVLQGFRMQSRVFCGPDQFHHIVRPLAEGTKATILAGCYADTVTVVEAEVVGEAKIFGDETPSFITTEDCDLSSLVHDWACGGCPNGGHVEDFVLRNGKASC
jgi:hypothetical protein